MFVFFMVYIFILGDTCHYLIGTNVEFDDFC